jgi:hypothetical protein
MRALILDGRRSGERELDVIQEALLAELGVRGWESEAVSLRDVTMACCTGCFDCWTTTPGVCTIRDAGGDVARAWIQSDLTVLLTPVTFGGYSSELKKTLDRMICLVSPFFTRVAGEVHHRRRYVRYPALLAIGWLPEPRPEEEVIFHKLVRRNALNMHVPAFASGIVYAGDGEWARRCLERLLERLARAA